LFSGLKHFCFHKKYEPPKEEKKEEPKEPVCLVTVCEKFKQVRAKHSHSTCSTCGTSACAGNSCAPAAPAAGTAGSCPRSEGRPKKEMPKELPKGGVTNLQIRPIVTPVAAPKPVIEVSGPSKSFLIN